MADELIKLSHEETQEQLKSYPSWEIDNGMLLRHFSLPGFAEAIFFVNAVAYLAEVGQHHPDLTISYNKITVSFVTHSAGGITAKDFMMAQKVDELWKTFDWNPGEGTV